MAIANPTEAEIPRSTQRLLDLLEIVLAVGPCNLTTAAAKAELTPTTALRHLRALEGRGYLERDEHGDFSAGPTMIRLSASLRHVAAIDQLVASAQPHLDSLAEATGESTFDMSAASARSWVLRDRRSARRCAHPA